MTTETENNIIVCEDVKKWFGDFQALKGVTISIKEREVVVVIGPSGSGKSTFIRCINRLEVHQEGRIIVDGIELSSDVRNDYSIRLIDNGKLQLEALVTEAEAKVAALETDTASVDEKELGRLHASLDQAVANHLGLPYYGKFRKKLSELYAAVVAAKLQKRGVKDLFRGKVTVKSSGKIKIVYDFADEEHVKDFVDVSKNAIRHEGKFLRVTGECRLLRGNPFKNTMIICIGFIMYGIMGFNMMYPVFAAESAGFFGFAGFTRLIAKDLTLAIQRYRIDRRDIDRLRIGEGHVHRQLFADLGELIR